MLIRFSADAVRGAVQAHNIIADVLSDDVSQMTALRNRLEESWQGSSVAKILDRFDSLIGGVRKTQEYTAGIAVALTNLADAFENVKGDAFAISVYLDSPMLMCPVPKLFDIEHLFDSLVGVLTIDTDAVHNIAENLEVIATSFSDTAAKTSSILNDLAGNWEGNSYVSYSRVNGEIVECFEQIQDAINTLASKINCFVVAYESIDESFH